MLRIWIVLLFSGLLIAKEHAVNDGNQDGLANNIDFQETNNLGKRGEERLKKYQMNASPCWMKAVSQLNSKCSEMTDIEQSILAMKFANCHFEKSGMTTYNCTNADEFKLCTNAMKKEDTTSFLVYTEFFTHVSDICFYLQSDIWRKRTAETISKLSMTTENTVIKLEKSLNNQKMVIEAQNKSLKNQINILKQEENLQQALKNSTASAKSAFEEMKQQANEQKAIFSNTFDGIFAGVDKVAQLQSMLLGEFIGLQSLAFYFITLITCYLLTSTPSTAGARLILFITFIILVFLEKILINRAAHSQDVHAASNESLHASIWQMRKIFIALSLFLLGYVASRYQDLNSINNKILREIQAQILEIQELEKTRQLKNVTDNDSPNKIKHLSDLTKTDGPPEASLSNAPVVSTPQAKVHSSFSSYFGMFTHSPFKSPEFSEIDGDDVDGAIHDIKNAKDHVKAAKKDLFSDDDDNQEVIKIKKSKIFSKKNFQKAKTKTNRKSNFQEKGDQELKENNISMSSRYNLRPRSTTPLNSPSTSFLSVSNSGARSLKKNQKKQNKDPVIKKERPFFSSDEDN